MVSIIIPLRRDQGYLRECVESCLAQFDASGDQGEVIILPDEPFDLALTFAKATVGRQDKPLPRSGDRGYNWNDPRIIQESTGPASPARKRNRGAQLSKGEILAFIDDDTRVRPGWLLAALAHFDDPKIGAVGGPSITPSDDPFWAQVSGIVYESWMMSAGEFLRYRPGKECDVHDFPSCNLLVRRSVFEAVGGFRTDFWPGEDTEFCLAVIKKGHRIRYEPRALIEHHRRPSLKQHFIQLSNYGLHRGYFAKRYPETSLRFQYFVPTLFVLAGTATTLFTFLGNPVACRLLLLLASLYFILILISLMGKALQLLLAAVCVILVSHVVYGISFLRGLIVQRLPEEKQPVSR